MRSPSRHAARRAVAAVLALALSGASRVALAAIPVAEHRCQCAAHGERHRCACPICAEKMRRARRGEIDRLPPCHRAMAEAELAEEEADERRGAERPCLRPTCGMPDPSSPPPAPELFTVPEPASQAARGPAGATWPATAAAEQRAAAPELPPPRA